MTKLARKPVHKNAPPQKLLKKIHALQKRGQFAESKPLCDALEAQGFEHPDFLHLHGLAMTASKELEGALVKVYAAHQQKPNDAMIMNTLGVIMLQMKELEASIELFKKATKANPDLYDPWKNLGIALRHAERFPAAEVAFKCAYMRDRTQIEPLLNIVYMLIDSRHYKKAEEVMDTLLEAAHTVTPSLRLKRMHIAARLEDFDYITSNRDRIDRTGLTLDETAELDNIWASYLQTHDRYDEAIETLEPWVSRDTIHQEQCVTSLGLLYAETGKLEEGIAYHQDLLGKNPDHVAGRFNLGLLQFKTGDVAEGYKNYEARWERREFPSKRRKFDAPRWQGEPIKGKKLLVWREQGIGDEVRYASILPELEALGGSVTFECSPKLSPLWDRSFPWAQIEHEGETECRGDETYADFDYQIPIGSLGAIFRPTVDDYEKKQVPWIRRYTETENRVRRELAIKPDETLIGVCWRSSNVVASRNRYFLDRTQLVPLQAIPNSVFLNVQYDCEQDEVDDIRKLGLDLNHYANLDQKEDLVGACGLIGACDIVISVGVSVADLAAGLGVPVVQIGKKSSEIFLGTDHVPWYPTCMSLRMAPDGGEEMITDIVNRWPSIMQWAETVTTAQRDDSDNAAAGTVRSAASALDLEYVAPAA
ncbi:tetratricopeptide repeat protein [Hoeflea prorocentri]|uniref:Tetratricopeptide repeat protein n=1 Tax=Hoeflea prorocentri TaxID=1922333 RepID=A0A9X3UQZ5_9HYPH|nr:tetratricopeptide repeat protein [Hoeflea prorocentri]MCY6383764.1 tetratricopeptide repeat protein [Hoeflea prorocentri]MDA5401564.1 tetratricopeptide repeat protein [Hoeflea prorocentri]